MICGARQHRIPATSSAKAHGALKLLRKPKNPAAASGGMTVSKNEAVCHISPFVLV
jgi:hypothetical protein